MITHAEFNQSTTATEVAAAFADEIKGKTVLITGCSVDTIGYATASAIAKQPIGLLIVSGRSAEKLEAAAAQLLSDHPQLKLRKVIMDLSTLKSVRKAADEVNSFPENVDVLICNAGLMAIPNRQLSEDGIEMALAANHIGHWLFTNLILDKLRAAAQRSNHTGITRVINISSLGQMYSPFRFSDYNFTSGEPVPPAEAPNWERLIWRGSKQTLGYEGMVAYGQSKTANVLFSVCLNERLASSTGIYSFALHPGAVLSKGGAPLLDGLPEHVLKAFTAMKSIDQGASTTLVAAFDPKLTPGNGVFLSDCQTFKPRDWATDPQMAEKLWKLSEKLTGEEFQL